MRALEPLFLLAVSGIGSTIPSKRLTWNCAAGAAALTCLLEMLYLCLRRQTYRRSSLQSHTKAICYLLLRMSGDACAAVLWFSTFVAACLPKRQDYRGFLQSPPYATWVASAVLALTEWYVGFEFNVSHSLIRPALCSLRLPVCSWSSTARNQS